MTDRPQLTSIDLWQRHEQRCLQTLRDAVIRLTAGPADEGELELNRRLYRAIIAVQGADAHNGREQLSVVVPEGRNPPFDADPVRTAREYKVPDFYWAYVDYLAPAPEAVARQFVVECKRLTGATKDWDYTAQYVHAGILRFATEEHGYGKGVPSGAMVGYLQAIDPDQALAEINACATAQGITPLVVRNHPTNATTELDHKLERPFRDSPFFLTHLWSDFQQARPK